MLQYIINDGLLYIKYSKRSIKLGKCHATGALDHNPSIYNWDAVLWLRIKMKVQTEAWPVQGFSVLPSALDLKPGSSKSNWVMLFLNRGRLLKSHRSLWINTTGGLLNPRSLYRRLHTRHYAISNGSHTLSFLYLVNTDRTHTCSRGTFFNKPASHGDFH